jgi:serine/threonine protein kinase
MASIVCPSCGERNSEFTPRCAACGTQLPLASEASRTQPAQRSASILQSDSLLGKSLGHYRVLKRLGTGGMGKVYAAEDRKLGRVVALKVLPPEMAADPERRKRFQREAKSVAALNHPNIITIHSVEEAEGLHFWTRRPESDPFDARKVIHPGPDPVC